MCGIAHTPLNQSRGPGVKCGVRLIAEVWRYEDTRASGGSRRRACRKRRYAAREQTLPEQKILHVLDRLTFGARPGDFEEVRRLGVEKWIELQLHPERIPENPALEARLKPLDTLRMETAEIFTKYFPSFRPDLSSLSV